MRRLAIQLLVRVTTHIKDFWGDRLVTYLRLFVTQISKGVNDGKDMGNSTFISTYRVLVQSLPVRETKSGTA